MFPRNPVVVVSHGSGVNGLGILRSLGRRGVRAHLVVARGSDSLAAQSRYCFAVHWMPEETPAHLLRILESIAAQESATPVLFCDSDEAMHLAADIVDRLDGRYLLTNTLHRIPELQDKEFQARKADEAGVPVPRSWFLSSWDDLERIKPAPGRKLIVKPNPAVFTLGAPFKIFFASDARDVRSKLEAFVTSPHGMIVQEFIEGADEHMWAVIGYRSRHGGSITMVTVSKTKQSGTGAGGVGIISQVKDCPRLKEITARLVETLEYQGAFAIEYKYSDVDQDYFFIEANYRTARIHVIGRRAGADLPAIMYADVTRQPEFGRDQITLREPVWYYDVLSCSRTFRVTPDSASRRLIARHLALAPFRRTEWAVHAWDDWAPALASSQRWAVGLATGALRRAARLFRRRRAVGGPAAAASAAQHSQA